MKKRTRKWRRGVLTAGTHSNKLREGGDCISSFTRGTGGQRYRYISTQTLRNYSCPRGVLWGGGALRGGGVLRGGWECWGSPGSKATESLRNIKESQGASVSVEVHWGLSRCIWEASWVFTKPRLYNNPTSLHEVSPWSQGIQGSFPKNPLHSNPSPHTLLSSSKHC